MALARFLTLALALAAISLPAYAQNDPAGPGAPPPGSRRPQAAYRLSPEQALAAWQIEAAGFARGLGLPEDVQRLVVDAYVKARQSYRQGVEKLRPEPRQRPPRDGRRRAGGRAGNPDEPDNAAAPSDDDSTGRPARGQARQRDDRPRDEFRQKMADLLAAEKKKLRADLQKILAGGQLGYAIDLLGTFSAEWDVMVHAVTELKLDQAKQTKALQLIKAYIAETDGPVGNETGDRRAAMRQRFEARRTMLQAIEGLLTDDEFAAFRRAVPAGPGSRQRMADRLAELDANDDGLIQREEVPEQMMRLFDRLDANDDGTLDEQELAAADQRRRGGRGGQAGRGGQPGRGGGNGREY